MTGTLIQRAKLDTERNRYAGEYDVKIRVKMLQGKELTESRREAWNRSCFWENITLPVPWSWTFSPQNCQTNFCCVSHSVSGTLFWQFQQSNTHPYLTPMHITSLLNSNQQFSFNSSYNSGLSFPSLGQIQCYCQVMRPFP